MLFWLQPAALLASPSLEQRRDRASSIVSQINQLDDDLELAVERFNQAQVKLEDTRNQLASTRQRLTEAEADLARSQAILNRRVAGIYKVGQTFGLLELILSSDSLGVLINNLESLQKVSRQDAEFIVEVKKSRLAVKNESRALDAQERKQAEVARALGSQKNVIESGLSERRALLEEAQAAIDRAERAERAERAQLTTVIDRPDPPRAAALVIKHEAVAAPPVAPAPAGRGGAVVAAVMAQLGKPYLWAASGPDSFDCSGLTMFVYAQVGVRLPHSAEAQYAIGRKITRDNLEPGDLIYGGNGGYITHVGIYIGGDSYISAPQTGDFVKVQSLSARRNYVGATRP
jgi:peptidoglycan DL-endopeptidase CwlO